MISTKPYLIRAIRDWASDNNLTPQILVDTTADGVRVPQAGGGPGQAQQNASPWAGPAMPAPGYSAQSFRTLFAWWIGLLVGSVLCMTVASGLLVAGAIIEDLHGGGRGEPYLVAGFVVLVPAMLAGLAGYVLWAILVYRWWRQIQDGYATTSAGKATGFQFIPFFNLYWWFVMIWNLAKDLNAYANRHGIEVSRPSDQLALWTCIVYVGSSVAGFCAGAFSLPLYLAVFVMLVLSARQLNAASIDIATGRPGGKRCVRCGYEFGVASIGRCPECGEPVVGAPIGA